MSLVDSLFDTKNTNVFKICDVIRETSSAINQYHKQEHLEKIYENALFNRLKKSAYQVEQQFPLKVYDEDGTIIGEYKTDLLVENCLIVEIKACESIAGEHIAQLLGYLRSSKIEHGLLINFGAPKLQIKKYIL